MAGRDKAGRGPAGGALLSGTVGWPWFRSKHVSRWMRESVDFWSAMDPSVWLSLENADLVSQYVCVGSGTLAEHLSGTGCASVCVQGYLLSRPVCVVCKMLEVI